RTTPSGRCSRRASSRTRTGGRSSSIRSSSSGWATSSAARPGGKMHRSEVTVDIGAVRRNARALVKALEGAQLWAVVKANAYGHGAVGVAAAVVEEGAGALCVATVAEGLELRGQFPLVRILVMGPLSSSRELAEAREAR